MDTDHDKTFRNHKRRGDVLPFSWGILTGGTACMTVFSVHISAESCTLNLLYVISKLSCKIDQVS